MWRRRLILIGTLGAVAGVCLIPLNPVNSKFLKLAWLCMIAGAWAGFLLLLWKRSYARIALFMLPIFLVIPFFLTGSGIDGNELRADYVRRMAAFEGANYYWGGESARGIDCSGLPRRAFRDALLSYGIRHADGSALRAYLEQWWFDASARALGEGYRDYTQSLNSTGTIREMDYTDLDPGDLAVTTSGIHMLAYFGDGKWIQADPAIGSVVVLEGRESENAWFRAPVTMHRWSLLQSDGNDPD